MSTFKVPKKVLNILESIRRNLCNEIERKDRKMAWINWEKVLASKKYGGLGVSSFFAFNRALFFKRVWHFLSQSSTLWTRTIKAIHDEKETLGSLDTRPRRSPWLEIVREINILRSKGTDKTNITRKPSKMGKHEHRNQKSTKEANDSKPKPRKVNYGQASVKESQTLVNKSQPLEDKNPNVSI
ncbi:hypothetical protein Tco_0805818 [Tanacetum coccineum]